MSKIEPKDIIESMSENKDFLVIGAILLGCAFGVWWYINNQKKEEKI